MNYIIMDLEWNQASYPPPDMRVYVPAEIIEIGAVKLDEERHYCGSFSKMVAPVIYPQLNHITEALTHITKKDLKNAQKFPEVFAEFISWCGSEFVLCTWGPTDITELQRNMKYYDIPLFPFPVRYYDIQKMFSLAYEDGNVRRSLETAVEYLHLEISRPFHRAIDDAEYTTDIFMTLDTDFMRLHYSIDTYRLPTDKKNEIYAYYENYSKYISRCFDDKVLLMSDKLVTDTTCYKCGRKLRKKIRWFSNNSKTYYCLCICPEHGYVKGKIRIKKSEDERYYAVRTIKLTDRAGADTIYDRQAAIRKRRRRKRQAAKQATNDTSQSTQ